MDRTARLIDDYAANFGTLSEEKAKMLLDEFLTIQREHVNLIQSFMPSLRKALPEKKVARYYQLENKINAVIKFELAGKIPLVR